MTVRLCALALDNWAILDGWAASRNMPPLKEMPLQRFANFVYWWATRNADEKEMRQFDIRLWRPPVGVVPMSGPWSAEAETAAFSSLKKAVGSK